MPPSPLNTTWLRPSSWSKSAETRLTPLRSRKRKLILSGRSGENVSTWYLPAIFSHEDALGSSLYPISILRYSPDNVEGRCSQKFARRNSRKIGHWTDVVQGRTPLHCPSASRRRGAG